MSTHISDPLLVAREGPVLTLTLHRPEKLNSFVILYFANEPSTRATLYSEPVFMVPLKTRPIASRPR